MFTLKQFQAEMSEQLKLQIQSAIRVLDIYVFYTVLKWQPYLLIYDALLTNHIKFMTPRFHEVLPFKWSLLRNV